MTDADLIEFATDFRNGILDGGSSRSKCAMVCWPLAGLLGLYGIECEAVESDLGKINHIWLRLPDGRTLDPTMDQLNEIFEETFPPVYLGPPTKYHRSQHSG